MSFPPALAQRQVALAALALLGAVLAFALAAHRDESPRDAVLPEAVPAPGGGWYRALAAPDRRPESRTTQCGYELEPGSIGVSHPVLPCGLKLYIGFREEEVLTQVLARGPATRGAHFGLTGALARELGIQGTTFIRWRYARAP